MAVDLGDLVDPLRRETSPPGSNLFPDSTDEELIGYLEDAFWQARLDGFTVLDAFTDTDGQITPIEVGGEDVTRDVLQIVVFYAALTIMRNYLGTLGQSIRAVAGPVEFETSTSATVVVHILNDLRDRRNILLERLSDIGIMPSYYIDSIVARDESLTYGDTYWPSGAAGPRRDWTW